MTYQQLHTVIVEVAGAHDGKIDTSTDKDHSHVQVQHGPAWVTCWSTDAVGSHAFAWATACNEGRGYLPEQLERKTARRRDVASVIVRQSGYIHPQVYQSMASRSRTGDGGERYLEVIVGTLRTRVYDMAAATSLAEIWAKASWTAQAIWSNSPSIDRVKVAKATKHRGLPAIAQEGLPPTP